MWWKEYAIKTTRPVTWVLPYRVRSSLRVADAEQRLQLTCEEPTRMMHSLGALDAAHDVMLLTHEAPETPRHSWDARSFVFYIMMKRQYNCYVEGMKEVVQGHHLGRTYLRSLCCNWRDNVNRVRRVWWWGASCTIIREVWCWAHVSGTIIAPRHHQSSLGKGFCYLDVYFA